MHNNYYLFKKQLEEIKSDIVDSHIVDVFTFRKDEIVLKIEKDDIKYLCIGINTATPYILLKPSLAKHKSNIELFPILLGQRINDILIIPFDKAVFINMENFTANAVFFGKGANFYVKDERGGFVDSFKKNIHETLYEVSEQYDFTNFSEKSANKIITADSTLNIKQFLQKNFGALNNLLVDEICFRIHVDKTTKLNVLDDSFSGKLLKVFKEITAEIASKNNYLYSVKGKLWLSIFEITSFAAEKGDDAEIFSNLNKAWDIYIYKNTLFKSIERNKKIALTAIKSHKNYLNRVLQQIEYNKDIEKKHEEAVLKGNLLLTHKIRIKPHQSKVTLKNIYSDTLDMIEIKMNPKKSVVENANLYFNKYKNINKIKEKWQVKKQTVEAEFADISNLEKQLLNSNDVNKLAKIKEQLIAMNLLQDSSPKSKQTQNLLKYSFNHLVLENEWELFIGKNGKNNDLLTFTFAHKWDIWLHAQGVPGSHVIIRVPNRNTNLPKRIIEKAAQITAYHSKAQHSGVVPVIYTFVKYVHRIRKADPGTVSVQEEKVIFVEPLNIQH